MNPETVVMYLRQLMKMAQQRCPARAKQIEQFLKENAGLVGSAPASSHKDGHCCFPGGLLVHTVNIIKISDQIHKEYFSNSSVTSDSVFFVAMWCSMGYVGMDKEPYFVDQNDQYYNNKLGYKYKKNDNLRFMLPQDRSLYWLNKYNIPVSEDEWCAIRNYAGPFHKENFSYTSAYSDLEYILMTSVLLATRTERNAQKHIEKDADKEVRSSS